MTGKAVDYEAGCGSALGALVGGFEMLGHGGRRGLYGHHSLGNRKLASVRF